MPTSIRTSPPKTMSWFPIIIFGTMFIISPAIAEEDASFLPLSNNVRIAKGKTQEVIKVVIDKGAIIPKELLTLLPKNDPNKLTKIQIYDLAKKHRLFEEWKVNPVLQFQDGDISYWYEQGKPAWNLELQFLARRIVIERAEAAKGKIPSQGDLSALSQPVFSWLHELAEKTWEQDKKN